MKKLVLSLIGTALFVSTASALTLAEKKQQAAWNKQLGEHRYVQSIEKNCGNAIEVELNESVVAPFMEKNTSAPSYCASVYSALNDMCKADDISKEAIAEGVQKVVCTLADDDKGGFELAEGTLTFRMVIGFANIPSKTMAFLNDNL